MNLSRDKGRKKIIILTGPTASGKTGMSLKLTKIFNAEIISADSRQIYLEMDVGTAKVTKRKILAKKLECGCGVIVEGVIHHLVDIVNPNEDFTVAHFKKRAEECMKVISKRNKIPFIVGGTGLYIKSLTHNLDFAQVEPNRALREELEKKSVDELVELLRQYDREKLKSIDIKNPRRLVRAVEIASSRNSEDVVLGKENCQFKFLQLGITIPQSELYRHIDERVDQQIEDGLVDEVKRLSQKYSFDLPSMSGIGYRQVGYYLRGEMSLAEAIVRLKFDTHHYAKRQMTWFKQDKTIKWLEGADVKTAEALVRRFLEE